MADFGDGAVGSVSQPCPLQHKKARIKITVTNEGGSPSMDVRLRLRSQDGTIIAGRTDSKGEFIFEGLEMTSYEFSLYELDANSWKLEEAAWKDTASAATDGSLHTVAAGEGVTKIAKTYGLMPETIWSHPKNAELRQKRKNMEVLNPQEDVLFIPAIQPAWVEAQAGKDVKIHRRTGATFLKVRFVNSNDLPRKNVEYLLSIQTEDSVPIEDRTGKTDADGYLNEPVPPHARKAEVFLDRGHSQESYVFDVGFVDPVDTENGIKSRLASLGFLTQENGSLETALRDFQLHHSLSPTGTINDETRSAIEAAYLI